MTAPMGITNFLNAVFGGVVASVMHAVGLQANPATVFNNTFSVELIIATGLIAFFVLVRLTLSVEKPGPAQQLAELIHEFVGAQAETIIGHGYERFQPFIACVALFILLCNLSGLIPGVQAPTSVPVVPLGVAVLVFIYYNFQGLRANGLVGYLKQFAGPVWWLIWLLLPIEIVSHLARVMSLTIRLYANMFAGDQVTNVFFSLVPVGVPVFFLVFHFFVSIVQAFVFMLLTTIYLALAVSHEH
jgi:F-type H+-transporting ATPase subunit a